MLNANSLALSHAQEHSHTQHVDDGQHHAGNQSPQDGLLVHTRLTLQHGDNTSGGATPGQQVHDGVHQNHQNAQVHHLQIQLLVDGNEGSAADQGSGGTVAVQGNAGSHNGGTQQNLHRVALSEADHGTGHRIKQAGIEHDGEVQNSEQQHDAGVGSLAYASYGPVTDNLDLIPQRYAGGIHTVGSSYQIGILSQEGAQQGKCQRNQQQRSEGLHFLGHDQCQEHNDHCPGDNRHCHRFVVPPCEFVYRQLVQTAPAFLFFQVNSLLVVASGTGRSKQLA